MDAEAQALRFFPIGSALVDDRRFAIVLAGSVGACQGVVQQYPAIMFLRFIRETPSPSTCTIALSLSVLLLLLAQLHAGSGADLPYQSFTLPLD